MKQSNIKTILDIHLLAFGEEECNEVAQLADDLLALPDTVSINAERDGKIVGNAFFTPFTFQNHPKAKCYLLSPCGVLPDFQGQGVGKELVEESIRQLRSGRTDALFVLGIPDFYPRFGYAPSNKQTPYPDLLTIPESWMELELTDGISQKLSGKTVAVEPLMQSSFWDTSSYE